MARGFDSKSVEEQQAAFAAKASDGPREQVSPEEAARQRERNGLLLSRKQVMAQLGKATSPRHRELLERALAELDRKIGEVSRP
ncbi:MAG TPA: hypothetical protein VM009_05595 [Terriglobales bacterium]|nr:hypothetical protein [Terriglobales bacterium]